MFPGIPAGGVSASSSASSQSSQTGGGISVGGINTGTQGVDFQTMLLIAVAAIIILRVLK